MIGELTAQEVWEANRSNVVLDGDFRVGDIAVYGPPYAVKTTAECVAGGSSVRARFEVDGRAVRLAHRLDLLAVVRP